MDPGGLRPRILRAQRLGGPPLQSHGDLRTGMGSGAALDSHYVRNWSIWLDLVILVRTVCVVIAGIGAY